jgi:hypothetical protein
MDHEPNSARVLRPMLALRRGVRSATYALARQCEHSVVPRSTAVAHPPGTPRPAAGSARALARRPDFCLRHARCAESTACGIARKSRSLCATEQPAPPQTILRQEDTLHAECHASCCMHIVRTGVELLRQNIVRPFDLGCARPTRDWRRNTLCSASHSAQTATASAVAMIFGQGCTGRCRWLHVQNIVKRPVLGRHVPFQVGSLLRLLCAALALTSSIQNITAPQPSADRLCSVPQSIDGYRAELECASARGVRAISALARRTHCSTEGARYGAQANAGSGNAC